MQTSRFPRAVLRFMWIFKKRPPKPYVAQIEAYKLHREQRRILTDTWSLEYLFARSKALSVEDLDYQQVKEHIQHLSDTTNSRALHGSEVTAIRCFLSFYKEKIKFDYRLVQEDMKEPSLIKANEYAMIKGMTEMKAKRNRGRQPDVESIKKVKFLKDHAGLGLRQIARALQKDVKTIHEQYHYDLSKLVGVNAELSTE